MQILGVEHKTDCDKCHLEDPQIVNGLCLKCRSDEPVGNEIFCPCGCGIVVWKKTKKK